MRIKGSLNPYPFCAINLLLGRNKKTSACLKNCNYHRCSLEIDKSKTSFPTLLM